MDLQKFFTVLPGIFCETASVGQRPLPNPLQFIIVKRRYTAELEAASLNNQHKTTVTIL
jgi:hypothetical protein